MSIRPLMTSDRAWVRQLLTEHWGSARLVTRGRVHQGENLAGFVALDLGRPVGLITYDQRASACEIVSLNSLEPRGGIGSSLVAAVRQIAASAGCSRLWLVTTNDNLDALRFWRRRGFALRQVHRNALAISRRLKPEIPLVGRQGRPIRHEIELELLLP